MARRLWIALAVLLTVCLLMASTHAEVPAPPPEFYFLDEAGVFSESTEGEIFFSNVLLYRSCGAQIVVVALKNLDGTPIDQYAMTLFNRWGIGSAKKNNGLLLLMDIGGEDYWAMPGMGVEEIFTPEVLSDILNRYLESDFAQGRYDAGVKACFEALFARMAESQGSTVNVQRGIDIYNRICALFHPGDFQRTDDAATGG